MDTHGHIIETPRDQSQDALVIFPNFNIYKYVNPANKFPELKGILRSCFGLGPHVFEMSKVLLFSLLNENISFLLPLGKKLLFCTIS